MSSRFEQIDDDACRRFQGAVELVGQRWSSGILLALARGATRFSDVLASVPGLSARLLTARLASLQEAGLVDRDVVPSTPVQIRYSLTQSGRELLAALNPVIAWGDRWDVR